MTMLWRMLAVLKVVCCLHLVSATSPSSIKRTYGIYGAIQSEDKAATAARLLEQCFAGFALNGCVDQNSTAKDYTFASQFTDPAQRSQQYCLQCCSHPVPRAGADETWDLVCSLNDMQRLSVSQSERVFRFARRDTLEDDGVVECAMPSRTAGTYLTSYSLELFIVERSASFGAEYWRSVVNCSVSITESTSPPSSFRELIRVRSVPTAQSRPTAWVAPTFAVLVLMLLVLAVPVYKGKLRGQRCRHCGSWVVFVGELCVVCSAVSCRLRAPPPKVYVTNGDPRGGVETATKG